MRINDTAQMAHKTAVEKGFWPDNANIGEKLMLVVSELGETCEAHRKGRFTDGGPSKFEDNLKWALEQRPDESQITIFKSMFEGAIKDTFEDELADAMIRIMDLAAHKNIDLEWHIAMKMRYNKTREHLHGKLY